MTVLRHNTSASPFSGTPIDSFWCFLDLHSGEGTKPGLAEVLEPAVVHSGKIGLVPSSANFLVACRLAHEDRGPRWKQGC
jgi:hypothetical protein